MPLTTTSWKPGQSGNPKGRPKNKASLALQEALQAAEKKNNKSLLEHFVQRAYEDDTVLIALMRKILPDVKFVAADVHSQKDISVTVSLMGEE